MKKPEEAERLTEISTRQGRGGSILKILKLAKTSRLKTTKNLRSKDGTSLIISSDKKLFRWKTYFEKYAKTEAVVGNEAYNELIPPSTTLDAKTIEVMSRPISKTELLKALKQSKLEMVPGIDEVSSNMLKTGAEVAVDSLSVISNKIWETVTIPKNWKNQIIVPINKHGSRSRCENYRGIALLCVAKKVFGRALLNRIQNIVEGQLGENQCGFRPNRGCCDQVFSARILMQKAIEFNKAIYICFVDLQKAYDTVNRDALWEVLKKSFNIPDKIILIIKALHSGSVGVKRDERKLSEEFPINVGVKQGDVLAPILFNMYLDAVSKWHSNIILIKAFNWTTPIMLR